MGNQGLQSKEIIISKFIDQSRKIQTLNKTESPWHETVLVAYKDEGPVVLKTLKQITSEQDFSILENEMKKKQHCFDPDRRHPNILLYHDACPAKVQLVQQTTVLLRQYICYNLSEKIHWLPHLLSEIEKKWLVFLILCGVAQIHSENQVHGDIKPENILVTSYDWLYIADMHTYKPVMIRDDNLKKYNQFFGDLDNNIRCYVAPERWCSPQDKVEKNAELKPTMDVFSAGCVIAEILMNGLPLFDLARLQQYRRGTFDPIDELRKRINDQKMVQLILSMISREPKQRPNILDCIAEWNKNVFPQSFSKVLFQIGSSFQNLSHLYSDNRISLVRYHIDSIFETCLGEFNTIETFHEPIEPSIFNLLESDDMERRFEQLQPKIRQEFKFYTKSQSEDDMCKRQTDIKGYEKDSLLIVVLWLGNMFQSSFYPQTKLVALEMIQRMSKHLPFQVRLNLVLPLVQTALVEVSEAQTKRGSTSKVKVKALDVMLGLFYELEQANEMQIVIEALDYKVASSYILPIVKRLMDSSKTDQLIRHAIALNVGRLARITARFLEVAISSCNRRREEALRRRQENKETITPEQMMTSYGSMHVTHFGNIRQTNYQKREDLLQVEVINPNDIIEEDLKGPSYDAEMENIWKEVQQIIENTIGAKEQEHNIIIAILQSSIELSQIFGAEKGDFLIQQCISGVNKKNFRVRQQALKTLGGLSFRVGEKKVEEYILPLAEQLLEDPEDIIILENIKMLNYLVLLRLVSKKNCLKLIQNLTPYLLYPNQQIRLEVATYICQLFPGKSPQAKLDGKKASEVIESAGIKITISKKPLISYEDFYCFVKPTLTAFVKECHQHEIMDILATPQHFLDRLRTPLNLKIMRAYFNQFARVGQNSQLERETFSLKEDKFTQRCAVELTPDDVFSFEILRGIFKQKLKQLTLKSEDKKEISFDKQDRPGTAIYRVIKQNAVSKIATGFQIQSNTTTGSDLNADEKARIIQQFTEDSERQFSLQRPATTSTNYGLNPKQDGCGSISSIPYEMAQILKSLEVIPKIPETKNFKNLKVREKGDVSRLLRVNSEMKLAARGAQASVMDQFDNIAVKQTVGFKVLDEHRKEVQNVKGPGIPNFRPHGTLITTLYEHKNPVNTVAVSEDQAFFMTGSRADRAVHVYSVKNVQEDFNANVVQFNTQSGINQICTVQNSNTLAVATEKGIELYDFSRLFAGAIADEYESKKLDLDEVVQIRSMQTPITYQNILVAATQSGSMLLYDLRSKQHILKDENAFTGQRGAVSAMCVGKDAFTLTVGTLGGYVATYDIRYGVTSALFKHHLNWPVLALSTYRKNNMSGQYYLSSMLSLGGPQHEMCQMNMETGQIEVLFRVNNQPSDPSVVQKLDIPNVPEYFRETNFKDNKFGTLKRDSNLRIFERSLLYLNQDRYDALQGQEGMRNRDANFMDMSTHRFKRISESYTCPNACRTILIPRDNFQSMMFDNETAEYAITAGNDRKIRYWNLYSPETLSYQINSPYDDEVSYSGERLTKSTKIVMEKLNSSKEFPKLTSARIKDQTSTTTQQMQKNSNYVWVKYADNTAYHNAIAAVAQNKHLNQNTPGQIQNVPAQPTDWNKFQTEEPQPNYLTVNTFNGLSQSQHLNNLAITADPIEDCTDLRISDVVSHQDAILDMAICGDMLVTCGRDGLVKLWK